MLIKDVILLIIELPGRLYNKVLLAYRKVSYPNDLQVQGRIRIYGRGRIEIGKQVRINSCELANPIGGSTHAVFNTGINGSIYIGDNTAISNCAIVAFDRVTVGKNVRIGGSCCIYDTDFHSLTLSKRLLPRDDDIAVCPVEICDGAFIGAFSIILKGVRIGNNSVIGAGSVVTRSVPDGEIWAGNPARRIRTLSAEQLE